MRPELIRVIVAGFPGPLATQLTQTCKKRGFGIASFGLARNDIDKQSMEVADVEHLRMIKFSDKLAREQILAEVDESKRKHRFPVIADVSRNPENAKLYNDCNIAFVMQSPDHDTRKNLQEHSKQFAVIAEDFNKQAVALDASFREFGRNFPGLFRGFDVIGDGLAASRHLTRAFNDLLDKNRDEKPVGDSGKKNEELMFVEGKSHQEFQFKDSSGSTTFSFRRSTSPEDFASGMADAILFLAKQAEASKKPEVFSMVDVLRKASLELNQ